MQVSLDPIFFDIFAGYLQLPKADLRNVVMTCKTLNEKVVASARNATALKICLLIDIIRPYFSEEMKLKSFPLCTGLNAIKIKKLHYCLTFAWYIAALASEKYKELEKVLQDKEHLVGLNTCNRLKMPEFKLLETPDPDFLKKRKIFTALYTAGYFSNTERVLLIEASIIKADSISCSSLQAIKTICKIDTVLDSFVETSSVEKNFLLPVVSRLIERKRFYEANDLLNVFRVPSKQLEEMRTQIQIALNTDAAMIEKAKSLEELTLGVEPNMSGDLSCRIPLMPHEQGKDFLEQFQSNKLIKTKNMDLLIATHFDRFLEADIYKAKDILHYFSDQPGVKAPFIEKTFNAFMDAEAFEAVPEIIAQIKTCPPEHHEDFHKKFEYNLRYFDALLENNLAELFMKQLNVVWPLFGGDCLPLEKYASAWLAKGFYDEFNTITAMIKEWEVSDERQRKLQ